MPLTPEDIKGHSFPINRRGYEKDEVDSFLQRVAADYEAAIAAIASAADPYGSLGQEVSNVLRTAKESAERLRRETEDQVNTLRQHSTEEAAEVQRRAAEEAAATLERAREKAVRLTEEAQRHAGEAKEESQAARKRASEEAAEIRRRAAEEAAATLDGATEKAERLTQEAHRHVHEVREAVERQADEMLNDAARRHEQLRAHERELHERVEAVDGALARLRAELRSGATASTGKAAGTQASPVVADRLRALEPDLDQVATALVDDDERAEDVIIVREVEDAPRTEAKAQPSGRETD